MVDLDALPAANNPISAITSTGLIEVRPRRVSRSPGRLRAKRSEMCAPDPARWVANEAGETIEPERPELTQSELRRSLPSLGRDDNARFSGADQPATNARSDSSTGVPGREHTRIQHTTAGRIGSVGTYGVKGLPSCSPQDSFEDPRVGRIRKRLQSSRPPCPSNFAILALWQFGQSVVLFP